MSSNSLNFQNNRIIHRNDFSQIQLGADRNTLVKSGNDKLDTANTNLTALHTQQDGVIGAINNTTIGDAQLGNRTYVYAHDVSNGKARALKCDANGRLECSVDALEVTAETINLSTDTLEAKTQAITDKLDTFAGAGNNNIGEGSSKLQTYLYARDVSAGNFKPLVCDGDAHLQVDVLSTALPTGGATEATLLSAKNALFTNPAGSGLTVGENASSINANMITQNSKIDTTNSLLGTIDTSATAINIDIGGLRNDLTENGLGGGKKAGVMLESQNANLIAGNAKLDDIKTNTFLMSTSIATETNLTALKNSLTGDGAGGDNAPGVILKAINDNIINTNTVALSGVDGTLQGIDTLLGDTQSANHTDLVALEASLTSIEGKIDTLDSVLDNAEAHLGNIDTGVDVLEACVGSNKVNVNISSGNISGFATESTLSAAEVHLGNIETAVQLLDDAIGTDGSTGPAKCISLGATESGGNIQELLCDGNGRLSVDVNSAPTTAVTNSGLTELAAAINSDRVDVNIANGGFNGAVTNAGTFAVQVDGDALTSLQLIDDVVKAEDAAHSGGDKGIMGLSVRKDTAAALGGSDADYQPLITDANGKLYTIPSKKFSAITTLFSGVSVGSSATSSASSAVEVPYESGAPSQGLGGGHRITFSSQASSSSAYSIALTESMDDSTYFTTDTNLNDVGGGAQQNFMGSFQTSARYFKLTITNTHAGSQDFTIKVIGGELS